MSFLMFRSRYLIGDLTSPTYGAFQLRVVGREEEHDGAVGYLEIMPQVLAVFAALIIGQVQHFRCVRHSRAATGQHAVMTLKLCHKAIGTPRLSS